MAKDDNEIIELSCAKCKATKSGTYKELFGELPSLIWLAKMRCKCGRIISIRFTGKYKAS